MVRRGTRRSWRPCLTTCWCPRAMKTERRIRRKTVNETNAATERATASVDETMEPIEASEERNAAMETEGMSGPPRG